PAHRDRHSFPTRRSSDLRTRPRRGRPRGFLHIYLLITFYLLPNQLLKNRTLNIWPTRHQKTLPLIKISHAFPSQNSLYTATPHADRKSTRLNSSHVKISY